MRVRMWRAALGHRIAPGSPRSGGPGEFVLRPDPTVPWLWAQPSRRSWTLAAWSGVADPACCGEIRARRGNGGTTTGSPPLPPQHNGAAYPTDGIALDAGKTWTVQVDIDEHEGRTRAIARLGTGGPESLLPAHG
jgi:hypothetical protein